MRQTLEGRGQVQLKPNQSPVTIEYIFKRMGGKSMRSIVLLVVAALTGTTALAQVYKCKDAHGRMVYSDTGCSAGQSGNLLQRQRSNEERWLAREEALNAQRDKEERKARELAKERIAIENQAIASAMQPQAPAHKGYAERLAERNAGVRSTVSGSSSASRGMTRSQREYALSQADTPQARREALREATTPLPGAHGLTSSQMDAAQRIYSAKPGQPIPPSTLSPKKPMPAPPPASPSVLTHCTGGICQDNLGGVYHPHGNGATMTGPNGGTCIQTGSMVQC